MANLEYSLEFDEKPRELRVIAERELKAPPGQLMGFLKKHVRTKYYRLAVRTTDLPSSLDVPDPTRLFVIGAALSGAQPSCELIDLPITTATYPIQVLFDPNQIAQYTDLDGDQETIRLELISQAAKNSGQTRESLEVLVQFNRANPTPKCRLVINPEFVQGVEHQKKVLPFGEIHIESSSPFVYAHSADCVASIGFGDLHETDLLFLGGEEEIRETNPVAPAGGLIEKGRSIKSVTGVSLLDRGRCRIQTLNPGNTVVIPVYIDLRELLNPPEVTEYEAAVRSQFMIAGQEVFLSDRGAFRITPDSKTTALRVEVFERGQRIGEGLDDRALSERRLWIHNRRGLQSCFSLRIGNFAESGTGAVSIRDFKVRFVPQGSPQPQISPIAGKSLSDVFEIQVVDAFNRPVPSEEGLNLPVAFSFPDGESSYWDFDVGLRHSAVSDIPANISVVEARVSFEVQVIPEGGVIEEDWRPAGFLVEFEVERYAGPYWLAIDFGTSAVVVAFDKRAGEDLALLDLQERRKELGEAASYTASLIPEYGTEFLSSQVLLRNEGTLMAPSPAHDLAVLAPERFALSAELHVLPPIKALVGSEELPALVEEYRNLRYSIISGGMESEYLFSDRRPRITEIVATTYNRLLVDYVLPILHNQGKEGDLNKVVFSIPNTFTPRHIDTLKRLVKENFPSVFRSDYTTFISESDSVAAYYLNNWKKLNRQSAGDERRRSERFRDRAEYVLVYDLGAGTLDLTYFRIVPLTSETGGEEREVTILGRMGTDTGGNYLDESLARAIVEQFKDSFTRAMFGGSLDPVTLGRRLRFKHVVEKEIKPRLGEDAVITIETLKGDQAQYNYLRNDVDVDLALLRGSRQFQDYLTLNTEVVLRHFFGLFNGVETDPGGGRQFYDQGEFPVDTVMVTGRGIQVSGLEDRIMAELETWAGSGERTLISGLDEKALKSSVIEGALQFVTRYRYLGHDANVRFSSRNVLARYGLLYQDIYGQWQFKELLNPATRPIVATPVEREGLQIYSYDTDEFDVDPQNDGGKNLVDLSNSAECLFVQSFSTDTAGDFQAGRTEFISTMSSFSPQEMGHRHPGGVQVRVEIDSENRMRVTVGDLVNDPTEPMKTNLEDSEAVRKGMWPYLDRFR